MRNVSYTAKYFVLEEAAQRLGLDPKDLLQMAKRGDIRGFMDRGIYRFRIRDIQERVAKMPISAKFIVLEEAALRLGLDPNDLVQMLKRGEIRGYLDRGTYRFPAEEIVKRVGQTQNAPAKNAEQEK